MTLISRIAERFGSQSVVVSVDIKRNLLKRPELYESRSAKVHKLAWLDFAKQAVAAGAGEVLLNAVDRDGEMQGMDLELVREASTALSVPLIALGGIGSLQDIRRPSTDGRVQLPPVHFLYFMGRTGPC